MANNHEIWFGVAAYRIVQRLPKELKGQLPGPEEIARLLEDGGCAPHLTSPGIYAIPFLSC